LWLRAVPGRKTRILFGCKLFQRILQAVPARQRREFFETSRCSRTKEGNSLLLQRILARQGWTLFDTSSCSRTKTWSLSDFKLFQEEERTSLGRQALPARQGWILWYFKLFPNEERESMTSSCSCKTRLHSLILQAVPARQRCILLDTSRCSRTKRGRLWLRGVRGRREEVSRTSTYSSKEGLHSLMLQAVPPRKKRILWYFKLFEQYKEENSLRLQAIQAIKKEILWYCKLFEQEEVEFFDASRCSSHKEGDSLWLQAVRGIKGCILWCFKVFSC